MLHAYMIAKKCVIWLIQHWNSGLQQGDIQCNLKKNLQSIWGFGIVHWLIPGSSANLLAFMALTSPLLEERQIQRGDEVITVAAGFPTTVAPIIQYGAVPVFVDVTIPQYNIEITMLEESSFIKNQGGYDSTYFGEPF